ncbi:MAG: mechanosensitive ion channel family protein [Candidatus Eisenbacteria bacterium]|nr:mechanosensitive ion channel family protein [Candidatus Eisenbacteria bacterium]
MNSGAVAGGLAILLGYMGFTFWQTAMTRRWAWLRSVRVISNLAVLSAAVYALLTIGDSPAFGRALPWARTCAQFLWAYLVIRLFDAVLFDSAVGRRHGVCVPRLLRDIIRWLAAFLLLLVILRVNLGINLTPLVATSAALTFVLGFALQDVLGNLFAGIAINFENPFSIGDYVSMDGHDGKVDNMNWRATRILTYNNEYVTVPNSVVAKGTFLNYSQPQLPKGRSFFISIGYEVRPNRVKAVLREALDAVPEVLGDPPPRIWLIEFAEHAISYRVKFWVRRFDDGYDAEDRVKSQVWYHLNRNGITIPYPRRTVQMVAAEEASALQSRHSQRAKNLLQRVPLFAGLGDERLSTLAAEASAVFYAAGEPLVRQGDTGDSLYLIQQGVADVSLAQADGPETTVARLAQGDFFGEMSLLTGEPRGATVRAAEDRLVLVIRKEHLGPMLVENPVIAESLAKAMERRQAENLAKIATTRMVTEEERNEASFGAILKRVKGFFGLR